MSELAARCVATQTGTMRHRVSMPGQQIANIQATGQAWVRNMGVACSSLGNLGAGNFIIFVDRDGVYPDAD